MQVCVLYKGTTNAVLTSSNNTITLPAGYYEESTITTSITSLPGIITYRYGHKHTGNDTVKGGCYTAIDSTRSWKCGKSVTLEWTYRGTDSQGRQLYRYEGYCPAGHFVTGPEVNQGWAKITTTCPRGATYYTTSCGYNDGDFVRESSELNPGPNEKVIGAVITY